MANGKTLHEKIDKLTDIVTGFRIEQATHNGQSDVRFETLEKEQDTLRKQSRITDIIVGLFALIGINL